MSLECLRNAVCILTCWGICGWTGDAHAMPQDTQAIIMAFHELNRTVKMAEWLRSMTFQMSNFGCQLSTNCSTHCIVPSVAREFVGRRGKINEWVSYRIRCLLTDCGGHINKLWIWQESGRGPVLQPSRWMFGNGISRSTNLLFSELRKENSKRKT